MLSPAMLIVQQYVIYLISYRLYYLYDYLIVSVEIFSVHFI